MKSIVYQNLKKKRKSVSLRNTYIRRALYQICLSYKTRNREKKTKVCIFGLALGFGYHINNVN